MPATYREDSQFATGVSCVICRGKVFRFGSNFGFGAFSVSVKTADSGSSQSVCLELPSDTEDGLSV